MAARPGGSIVASAEKSAMSYLDTLRAILNRASSFVLFKHGTFVVFPDPAAAIDLASMAKELLRKQGRVQDFEVLRLAEPHGWAVASHHPDIHTLVGPDEVDSPRGSIPIGLVGRQKRNRDAETLEVLHVEDRRDGTGTRWGVLSRFLGGPLRRARRFFGKGWRALR